MIAREDNMICWYCKSLIADNASVCPCCGVAVVNPARELVDYPVYDEFRQNGYVNPYEEYYRNFQLPQMMPQLNPSMFGQYNNGFGGMLLPQYPASAMAIPMQNPFAPFQVVGVIYPQSLYQEDPKVWAKPKEEEKPEIETVVKDEPVVILEQSEVDGSYVAETHNGIQETETEKPKQNKQAKKAVAETKLSEKTAEPKKTNILAIFGFIFAFILPVLGLILSSVGLSGVKKKNLNGKGLAVAGIIISLIMIFVYSALAIIFSEPLLALIGL